MQADVGSAAADTNGNSGTVAPSGVPAGLASARFEAAATADVGGMFPGGLAVADFTGDGRADVAVAVSSVQSGAGVVVVVGDGHGGLAGRGDGSLRSPVGYSTGPQRLTAAELGGSAATDLVSLSQDPGTLYGVLGGGHHLGAASLVASSVPG